MLIKCTVYKNGIKHNEFPLSDIAQFLNKPEYIIWAAFRDANKEELNQIQDIFDLHEVVMKETNEVDQRPRMAEYTNAIYLSSHLLTFTQGKVETGEMSLLVGSNYVLTFRKRSEHQFLGMRERCEKEPELLKLGSGYIFYSIMDEIVNRYVPIVDQIEDEIELLENKIFEQKNSKTLIKRLYSLKKEVNKLHHATAPLIDVLAKLFGGRIPTVCTNFQEYFRHVHKNLIRLNSSIDAMRDTLSAEIQVTLALSNIDKSEITKKLAAWAAIFAVCTTLVGIWGMNFKHMPELEWQYGYPVALAIIIGAIVYLYKLFKKSEWL